MLTMMVSNRVEDYDKWKAIFDAQGPLGQESGLVVTNLWRDIEDPNNIFFTLSVSDLDKAKRFLADPNSEDVGKQSGVIEGEAYFVEDASI